MSGVALVLDDAGLGDGISTVNWAVSHVRTTLLDRGVAVDDARAIGVAPRERPASPIRGINRRFVSDVEDLPWFLDRAGWQRYLTMLATHRYNRIHLAFGIGHDFLRHVQDAYLLFAYPFLVDVPDYDVQAVETSTGRPISADERKRNLDTLRFISDEAAMRGLHFQLGIWTHGCEWTESPNASHVASGLTPENHAAYCRDALRMLLETCPGIASVTLRVHGESGVTDRTERGSIQALTRRSRTDRTSSCSKPESDDSDYTVRTSAAC